MNFAAMRTLNTKTIMWLYILVFIPIQTNHELYSFNTQTWNCTTPTVSYICSHYLSSSVFVSNTEYKVLPLQTEQRRLCVMEADREIESLMFCITGKKKKIM